MIEDRYLVVAGFLVFLLVIGMGIFLLWQLFEPRRGGKSRSVRELIVIPAAVMTVGVLFIGICMLYPAVLFWGLAACGIYAVVEFARMPASRKAAVAEAIGNPDPAAKWSFARLILATVVVFAIVFGLIAVLIDR